MFSFTGLANVNRTDTVNGLNQVTATGGTSVSHDARGNISAIGTAAYGYSSENLLVSAPNNVTFSYDPLRRLDLVSSPAGATRFLYDGDQLIAEYDAGGSLLRRFVHGPGIDEPLVWYEGSGTSDRRWSHADERGSVVEHSDGGADIIGTPNRYDEYGAPQGALTGRFGYTGQAWLPEAGLYYYRARMYNPALGRFMQTDPIGYAGGMNLYAYARNDPINLIDPSGLQSQPPPDPEDEPIFVTGRRLCSGDWTRIGGSWICYNPLNPIILTQPPAGVGGWHWFLIVTWLTPETQCTVQERDDAANRHRFPGQDPTQSLGPERQREFAEVARLQVFGQTIRFGGPIITSSPEPGVYVNRTEMGHPLHSPFGGGGVVRITFSHGGWHGIATHGSGTNYFGGLGAANQVSGVALFVGVDAQLQEHVEQTCGTGE